MPRSFDLTAEYDAPVEHVHRAFRHRDYWLDRLTASGLDLATLDSIETHPDGSVEITTTQAVGDDRVPGWVFQFYRGDIHIVRTEKWGPIIEGQASADVSGAIEGAPAKVWGKALLRPADHGSRLEFNVTVEISIPLVGGKIENFIGGLLAQLIAGEQAFTMDWLAQNPGA